MNKSTIIRTATNLLNIMGEDQIQSMDEMNYKQALEEFESVIDDFNNWAEQEQPTTEDCLSSMGFEDEPTEEVKRNKEQNMNDRNIYIDEKAFLKNIGFKGRVSQPTLDNLKVTEYIDRKSGATVHCVSVDGEYYLANRKSMYEFIGAIQTACKRFGAKCTMVRPPRGASFCQITWPTK